MDRLFWFGAKAANEAFGGETILDERKRRKRAKQAAQSAIDEEAMERLAEALTGGIERVHPTDFPFESPDVNRKQAERVLGKAVHPRALDRLFQIWPEAEAQVRHGTFEHQSRRKHWTEVTLHKPQPVRADVVSRRAYVHPDDQRDRRKGIDIAFRRALREVARRHKLGVA